MRRSFLPLFAAVFIVSGCFFTGTQEPAPATHYGISEGAGSAGAHTVIEDDTLYSIAQHYHLAMRDIAAYNNLAPPFHLVVGQRLRLPPPQEYRVKPGDTLYTISRMFGVNTSELASLNNLRPPYALTVHQELRLPLLTRKTQEAEMVAQGEVATVPEVSSEILAPPLSAQTLPPPVETVKVEPIRHSPITAKTPKRSSGKFMRPVEGRVVSSYGPKAGGLHNDGINIEAPRGTSVKAAENGVVVYAGNELKGSGNLVLVRHEGRWMTAYAHMDKIAIKRGDVVSRGQVLGGVGSTGSVDSPQLHFEVRRGTDAINPAAYLGG